MIEKIQLSTERRCLEEIKDKGKIKIEVSKIKQHNKWLTCFNKKDHAIIIYYYYYYLFDKSPGNHAIAIVKAPEKYDTLKVALANVIRDVNALNDAGWIEVDGQRCNLEFFLGGDYKVLN